MNAVRFSLTRLAANSENHNGETVTSEDRLRAAMPRGLSSSVSGSDAAHMVQQNNQIHLLIFVLPANASAVQSRSDLSQLNLTNRSVVTQERLER